MKALAAIIAFVAGVAVTAVACGVFNSAREGRRQVQLLSDVHDPLRQCLEDVVQTYDRGDAVLAERKAWLLQKRWSEYVRSGGRGPEQFSQEIMELGSPATATGGRRRVAAAQERDADGRLLGHYDNSWRARGIQSGTALSRVVGELGDPVGEKDGWLEFLPSPNGRTIRVRIGSSGLVSEIDPGVD